MVFSIVAQLPMGTYRGHAPDGSTERFPSVARLHAALLSAAGFGPRAERHGDDWGPSDADEAALLWLEDNPPDAVSIPAIQVNRARAIAYRDDGTIKRIKQSARIKKLPKPADTSVAVAGSFCWTWTTHPPPEVVAALELLCPDVSHLGTTESPVRLSTTTREPNITHRIDPAAGLFDTRGRSEEIDLPAPGRVAVMVAAHTASQLPVGRPSQDKATGNEQSAAAPIPRHHVRPSRYVSVDDDLTDTPWPEVIVLPLSIRISQRDKVRWATAAHRALISIVGDGAPPVLTGAYPDGMPRPANRLALHILDHDHRVDQPGAVSSALVVMIPRGASEPDVAVILDALARLQRFRGPAGRSAHIAGAASSFVGQRFWPDPAPGTVRLWSTCPLAIPDTRGHGPGWTFGHAALLSLAFVWQGSVHLPQLPARSRTRNLDLVDAVAEAGAAVVSADPLRSVRVEDYVHRAHENAVVRPYRAVLSVGPFGGASTLQAIGQSRHLGGGLLVPDDHPEGDVIQVAVSGGGPS